MKMKDILLEEALEASLNSYSPYSNFPVGAAVLCEDGSIVKGCNIENASFKLTTCAEAAALVSVVSQGKKPIELAVTCPKALNGKLEGRMPCGACRQIIAEHMHPEALIHIDSDHSFTVEDLLPIAFSLKKES